MKLTEIIFRVILSASFLALIPAELWAAKRVHYAGNLRLATKYDLRSLDPIVAEDPGEAQVVMMAFSRLAKLDPRGELQPSLAQSWTADESFKIWNFELHKNVKFHDGNPLRAKDVKFSLERLVKSSHHWVGKFLSKAILGGLEFSKADASEISGIVVVNPYHLLIQTVMPQPELVELLSLPQCSIVKPAKTQEPSPKEAVSARKGGTTSLVGSGPFFISQHVKNKIILNAFDLYFEGRPFLDRIEIDYRVNPKQQLIWFKLGRLDLIDLALAEKGVVEKENMGLPVPNLKAVTLLMGVNPFVAPLRKAGVREAIDKILEREVILKVLLKGDGRLATGYIPPQAAEFAYLRDKRTRSVDVAQKLMIREQAPAGDESHSFIVKSSDEYASSIVQRIALNLREVGLKTQIESLSDETFSARFNAGRYDLFLESSPLRAIAAELQLSAFLLKYAINIPAETLSRVTGLLNSLDHLPIPEERLKVLYLIEKEILDDYTLLPLFHISPALLANENISGLWADPLGSFHFEDAWRKQ